MPGLVLCFLYRFYAGVSSLTILHFLPVKNPPHEPSGLAVVRVLPYRRVIRPVIFSEL